MTATRKAPATTPTPSAPSGASTPAPRTGGAAKKELRGTTHAEGEAALAPPVEGAAKKKTDGSIASQAPAQVDLQALRLGFTIPANKKLGSGFGYEARTNAPTGLTLTVSPRGLNVSCNPGLYVDAMFPAKNMVMYDAGVRFGDGASYANFSALSGLSEGIIDLSSKGESAVKELIDQAIAGTAMARPGYNPLTDTNLMQTLARIKANFDALPSGGGADAIGANEVSRPQIGATLAMRAPFEQGADGAAIKVPAGGSFDVDIQGSGNLATILAANASGGPGGAAIAAGIQSISVSSDSIDLWKGREAIAKLKRLRIARGGQVTLEQFEMTGGLGAGAGLEALIRLIGGIAQYGGAGASPELAARITIAKGEADPQIVRGLSKSMIEQGLTDAVRRMLTDNRNAIPGVDLSRVFGSGG